MRGSAHFALPVTLQTGLVSGRALGSVVEHRLHTAGVSGSNPLAPTIHFRSKIDPHKTRSCANSLRSKSVCLVGDVRSDHHRCVDLGLCGVWLLGDVALRGHALPSQERER